VTPFGRTTLRREKVIGPGFVVMGRARPHAGCPSMHRSSGCSQACISHGPPANPNTKRQSRTTIALTKPRLILFGTHFNASNRVARCPRYVRLDKGVEPSEIPIMRLCGRLQGSDLHSPPSPHVILLPEFPQGLGWESASGKLSSR
jgi:hypothetical protein